MTVNGYQYIPGIDYTPQLLQHKWQLRMQETDKHHKGAATFLTEKESHLHRMLVLNCASYKYLI